MCLCAIDISVRCEKTHAEMEMRMGRLEEQEMEQIQKGLEDFLNQELGRQPEQKPGWKLEQEQEPEQNLGQEFEQDLSQEIKEMREEQREPQIYTLEDWDSPEQSRRRSRAEQSRSTRNSRAARNYRNPEWDEERTGSRRRKENYSEDWEEKPQSRREAKKAAKRAKRQRRKRKGIKLLAILLFLILLLGAGLYSLAGVLYNKLNYEEIASVSDLPLSEDGVVNILLIGNDSRENGEDGRSDAMILLSISRKTKTIYMTSLLRVCM